MTTAAIVNVRLGSSRLPGKALRVICGKPLLQHLCGRLSQAESIDHIVVATSLLESNDPIAAFCAEHRIICFRGDEDDVLGRTVGALQSVAATSGVVVFGDGPLIDPRIVDHIANVYLTAGDVYDFVGNDLITTYPPGMEVETFSVTALADAHQRCGDPNIREHGTLYLRSNPSRYRLLNVEAPPGQNRADLQLEVDQAEDLKLIEAVLGHFAGKNDFSLPEIIAFLDANPDIVSFNRDVSRRWKAYRSEA